jgi:adenylate kinase family enzyme
MQQAHQALVKDSFKLLVEIVTHEFPNATKDFPIINIIGKPGCGKGTILSIISQCLPHAVLVGSQMLKEYHAECLKKDSSEYNPEIANQIAYNMTNGLLTSKEIFEKVLFYQAKTHKQVAFDGFPKTLDQYEVYLHAYPQTSIAVVIDITDELSAKRQIQRSMHEILLTGKLSRNDATKVQKRKDEWYQQTVPMTHEWLGRLEYLDAMQPNSSPLALAYRFIHLCYTTQPKIEVLEKLEELDKKITASFDEMLKVSKFKDDEKLAELQTMFNLT